MIPEQSRRFFQDVQLLNINALNACNLRCSYCAVRAAADPGPAGRLAPADCVELIEFALRSTRRGSLNVELMGGEPLLLGRRWFELVLGALRGGRARFAFSTNATLLDDGWAGLLARHGVNVNVSLDGPAAVHDAQRGLHRRAVAGLKALQRAGMRPHVISIATAPLLERMDELLELFLSLGVRTFYLNPVRDMGRAATMDGRLVPTAQALADADIKVLEHMRRHRLALREVQLLERVFRYFGSNYYANFCNHATCPAGGGFLGVDAAGNVFPCAQETSPRHCLGNIHRGYDQARVEAVLAAYHSMPPFYLACLRCAASDICFFGCPASRQRAMRHARRDCGRTQRLYEHFRRDEALARELYELGRSMPLGWGAPRPRREPPAPVAMRP